MNKKKKVSMQDIADALGVSKFSVSVAISDSYGVSEDLRLKILVKAMEMGYDFGRNNKRKNRKNNTVTLLVGGVEKAESIFWSSLIRSIEKTLVNENFDFSILIISNYETPKEMVARIYENHSVGVILISDCSEEIMMEIENLKIPAVIVDSAGYLSLKHNFISADNYAAGMFAAQTFIGLGHRDIAFVGEKRYAYSFAERCNGFVDEAEKNRSVRVYTVQSGRVNDAFDLDYMKEFIAEHGEVSAYFCANDSTALALHYHLDEINVKVPEEVSIIGFDNLQAKSVMRYNFTTFEVNQKQIARETVKVLVDNIRNGTEVKKSISVNTIFLKGKTVAEYKPR